MAATLPHGQRLKLAQVLAQWRHWDCDPPLPAAPEPGAALGQGFSNINIRVDSADGRAFVVRLDGVQTANHGISRQAEWRALGAAHRAGLAPAPRYFNPDLGALVCDYLAPDASQPRDIAAVATLLRRIHALPPLHYRLDLGERVARYRHQCARRAPEYLARLSSLEETVSRLLDWQRDSDPTPVLCHNDLLAANRFYSGGHLWALDWEYAAMGSRWFDLAVVCCDEGWSKDDGESLLQAYLQRPPEAAERRGLTRHCVLYRYIELLWFANVNPGGTDWPRKLAALERATNAL